MDTPYCTCAMPLFQAVPRKCVLCFKLPAKPVSIRLDKCSVCHKDDEVMAGDSSVCQACVAKQAMLPPPSQKPAHREAKLKRTQRIKRAANEVTTEELEMLSGKPVKSQRVCEPHAGSSCYYGLYCRLNILLV